MAENSDNEMKEASKPSFKEIGRSGTLVSSKMIDDEYLNELKGVDGQKVYEKMLRSDSGIRKPYHAVNNPIRSAKWDIQAASDSEQDLKVAALIRHIIFNDIPGGWKSKLDEIVTFPWHGHAVFEIVNQNRHSKSFGPYTGLKNLAFRDQRTLTEWNFEAGVLKTVKQEQQGDLEVSAEMPAENLLIFYNEKKGDDIGYPFLRMLYGNYKRKLLYKQLQAIGIERSALPVPKLTVPKEVKTGSEEWNAAESQLRAFTLAESSFFMMPEGYTLDVGQTSTFNPAGVQLAIKAENEEIAGSLVAMFLEMGIGGNSGNQAGTEVSAAFFRDGIEYLADKIAETVNLYLIPKLCALNFGDTLDVLPKLMHAGITDEAGKEIMEIITGYAKNNIITPDEALEDYVRKQHNLPKKAAGEQIENEESDDGNNDPDDSTDDDNADDPEADKNKKVVPAKKPKAEVKLNDKFTPALNNVIDFAAKPNEVQTLMSDSAKKITEAIKDAVTLSGNKFIADTMNKYKQLSDAKKQEATTSVVMGGSRKFKDAIKKPLTEAAALAISGARKEIPDKKDIELKTNEADLIRLSEKYGDISEIKLNEFSKLPSYIQVLISKQTDLISEQTLADLKAKLSFTYSSIQLKSDDINIIKQNMEEALGDFKNTVAIKGENVSAMMVNEGRNSFFFDDDVVDSIHSFTFMNRDPKSPICKELAGVTFTAIDAESLRYSPPLHHNCKSYLRANLKTSKGVEKLEVKTLSPSAAAIKSITL
jgi:hypothetical protein